MKRNGRLDSIKLVVFCLLLLALLVRSSSSSPSQIHFLGIPPQDYGYYGSSDVIQCKDGSKKFTKSQLNDDFCDCPDGTDEPGTSACPSGKFYCTNAGHVSLFLFSSRVNDGICDCCDGSDEYDGKVECKNTCWEAGKVARDKLQKKIATYEEGVAIRKLEVEQAKLAVSKDEAELSKLKSEEHILKGLVQKLKEHKERIEKAEEKERLQKEKEEKEKDEAQKKASGKESETQEEVVEEGSKSLDDYNDEYEPTESAYDKSGILDDSSSGQEAREDPVDLVSEGESTDSAGADPSIGEEHDTGDEEDKSHVASESVLHPKVKDSIEEVRPPGDKSENLEELSREELGRLVASRWTGENKQTEEVDTSKDNSNEVHDEIQTNEHEDEYDGDASESDEDSHRYDDDAVDEIEEDLKDENHGDDANSYKYESDTEADLSEITSKPSWLEKIQQTVRDVLQAVNIFQAPLNQSDADHVRKEYDESSARLSKIQSRISSLTQKLKHDFGPEKEFYLLYDHCLESKQNKYVYKVCPYKRASQVEGHSTTRLGQWEKFEESYRAMIFSSGDKCWNGPDRSLKVRLRCGVKNEVADVDEPSRCEYLAVLSTPSVCLEEKLQELKNKLQLMNEKHPSNHDEL